MLKTSAIMLDSLAQRRARQLNLATLVLMLWALVVMLVLKLLVGWATSSIVLMATAMHTVLSAFSTLISLQGRRFPKRARSFPAQHGHLEIGTTFLLWALLGFGELSLLVMIFRRWQGATGGVILSMALVQLVGLMGLVGFCFAFMERYVARVTDSPVLSSNASLILQEAWLNLLALCSLLFVRYGYGGADGALALLILLFVVLNAWGWLRRQLPQLFHVHAIAPEAIAHIVQRTEGVLRCVPLRSDGLVGRQVQVRLQLQLHPEFEAMATTITQRIEIALRQHYGPVVTTIEIVDAKGAPVKQRVSPPQDRRSLDFLDWN